MIQAKAEADFRKQVQFEKDHPSEILSFQAFYDTIIGSEFENDNPLKSFSYFMDVVVIIATLILGCYTFGLFCTTMYYTYKQSSMVDDHKRSKFLRLSKSDQKALQSKYQSIFKKKRIEMAGAAVNLGKERKESAEKRRRDWARKKTPQVGDPFAPVIAGLGGDLHADPQPHAGSGLWTPRKKRK